MLDGLWAAEFEAWKKNAEPRPPVFILVCKNTALANVVFDWLANGNCPSGIPPAKIDGFRNTATEMNTIVVACGYPRQGALSRRLRRTCGQTQKASTSTGPRRSLHRQRRNANRGIGLEHGTPYCRVD